MSVELIVYSIPVDVFCTSFSNSAYIRFWSWSAYRLISFFTPSIFTSCSFASYWFRIDISSWKSASFCSNRRLLYSSFCNPFDWTFSRACCMFAPSLRSILSVSSLALLSSSLVWSWLRCSASSVFLSTCANTLAWSELWFSVYYASNASSSWLNPLARCSYIVSKTEILSSNLLPMLSYIDESSPFKMLTLVWKSDSFISASSLNCLKAFD